MANIGPHSRPGILAVIDGRRAEAKLMRDVRAELTAHCGGSPSATQRMIITRAVMLSLRLHLMDKRFAETGAQTDHDSRCYLAWSNSLTRTLRELGVKGAAERAPTLQDYFAGRAAASAPADAAA
jgi:hypothetical protein